ncbi:MAG: hypothetical protein LQ342_000489 [Letrouitia transgressa]|nr:MAG: hypothetical protein LQ342_000489 [Letrouitia transgressa]
MSQPLRSPPDFYAYPECRQVSDTGYSTPPANNPVVRGLPLAIIGSIAKSLNLVSGVLWNNAGFSTLRNIKPLDDFKPRYDPTVIPFPKTAPENPPAADSIPAEEIQSPAGHYSAAYYVSAYKSGKLTPTKVAQALLDNIESGAQHKVAFLQILKDEVLAAAERSTTRYKNSEPLSPLDGVPVAVKDEVDLAGYARCNGSPLQFSSAAKSTSWCVQQWASAGAVIIGKLNMHELGLDTTNNNPVKGTPLNPHNTNYYTGGSSGGSAYAISAGLVPIALGADGGGSIRIPSAYCGLYGLKPSHGRISGSPTVGLAPSTGVFGPMASSMADLELAYRVMATPDPSDPTSSLFAPSTSSSQFPTATPKVLGIYKPWFDAADASVLSPSRAALGHFESLGYSIVDITLPYLPEGQLAHAMTILAEISSAVPPSSFSTVSPANKILLSVGRQTPATDLLQAQKMRNLLMQHLAFLFQKHPGMLIVSPTTPNAGWHISGGKGDLKHGVSDANMSVRSMTYVWLANFVGCPAISIPVGMAEAKEGDGKVPVGLMAMGAWGNEERLIEWGKQGEEWAWRKGEEKLKRAKGWVDVVGWVKR